MKRQALDVSKRSGDVFELSTPWPVIGVDPRVVKRSS